MDRDTLLLGLAAVFAGIAVLMGVLAFTSSLFLLVVSLPFGVTAYLMWEQATGRLERRVREREARRRTANAARGPTASRSRFGREARRRTRAGQGAEAGRRAGRTRTAGGRANARAGRAGGAWGPEAGTGMSVREAYRELDLSPGASQADVKRAYRERVKETHPDSGGDEEAFKRATRAYDVLSE